MASPNPEDIKKAITLGLNNPMGPDELLDHADPDAALEVFEVFMDEFQESKYRPSPPIEQMVRAGTEAGRPEEGSFEWSSPSSTNQKPWL